jgi:hypothetical protein
MSVSEFFLYLSRHTATVDLALELERTCEARSAVSRSSKS